MPRSEVERQQAVQNLLHGMRGIEPLKKLFWTELNYDRTNSPLPRKGWGDQASGALAEDPLLFATGGKAFQVIYARLKSEKLLMAMERPVVSRMLQDHPYALFVFSNAQQDRWHLINVKYDDEVQKRRVFRRITVGSGERLRTASERLAMLDLETVRRGFAELSPLSIQAEHDKAFDVEAVTKLFFKEFADLYVRVVADISQVRGLEQNAGRLAQQLMDRMLFLYFIQKKGWLNQQQDYLYSRFLNCWRRDPEGASYYSSILYPLFRCLSVPNTTFDGIGSVPFLNGGLFEERSTAGTQAERIAQARLHVRNSTFKIMFHDLLERFNFTVTEDTPLDLEVAIDPEMLGRIFESLILELEKDPHKDLRRLTGSYYTPRSVVHFMCEEGLKEYLASHLAGTTSESRALVKQRVSKLFALPPADQLDEEHRQELSQLLTPTEAKTLKQAVLECLICDPAVGSGAFPVGMLHAMVSIVSKLDVRLEGPSILSRRNYDYDLKKKIIENCLYGVDIQDQAVRLCELRLWLSLIVDYHIDSAKSFRNAIQEIPNLPNLSYRIMQGDSLLERLFGHVLQLDEMAKDPRSKQLIESIQADKQAYFREGNASEKRHLELKILAKHADLAERLVEAKRAAVIAYQTNMFGPEAASTRDEQVRVQRERELEELLDLKKRISTAKSQLADLASKDSTEKTYDLDSLRRRSFQTGASPTFIWRVDFAEVFVTKAGFDIIIENPPYGAVLDDVAGLIHKFYPASTQRHKDSYKNFIDLSLRILRPGGIYSLITPNTFIKQPRYEDVRKLLSMTAPTILLNLGENIFEDSIVPVAVTIGPKTNSHSEATLCADISHSKDPHWKAKSVSEVRFEAVSHAALFKDCSAGLMLSEQREGSEQLRAAREFFDVKDAGINYQRTNVGMKVKGNSDLGDRLLYEGKREAKSHKMFWKGADINRFYLKAETNRWCRSNYKEFIRPGEVVRLNEKVFSTTPKVLIRQTAD